jgi:hypothetical protein
MCDEFDEDLEPVRCPNTTARRHNTDGIAIVRVVTAVGATESLHSEETIPTVGFPMKRPCSGTNPAGSGLTMKLARPIHRVSFTPVLAISYGTFFPSLLPAATEPGPVDRTELVATEFHKILPADVPHGSLACTNLLSRRTIEAGLTYQKCGATIGPEPAPIYPAAPWSELTDSVVDSSLTNSQDLVGGLLTRSSGSVEFSK